MTRTLLEQRQEELKELIDTILVRADTLRKCVEGGYSDVNNRVRDLASVALDARLVAAKVDDLKDVTDYGPGGGRWNEIDFGPGPHPRLDCCNGVAGLPDECSRETKGCTLTHASPPDEAKCHKCKTRLAQINDGDEGFGPGVCCECYDSEYKGA